MDLDNLKSVRRGYVESDLKEFTGSKLKILKEGARDVSFLLNRGYKIKNASTFVGNHYLLSERQRLFLCRALSCDNDIKLRATKMLPLNALEGETVYIDGFNTIITLETALSNSLIFKCCDNTIRDLAGLRGTYKIIDKTVLSLKLILDELEKMKIKTAVFYLDAPVSNSGRLKKVIELLSTNYNFHTNVQVINKVDITLESKSNIITTDAIILNKCTSWFNLNTYIVENKLDNLFLIDIFTY